MHRTHANEFVKENVAEVRARVDVQPKDPSRAGRREHDRVIHSLLLEDRNGCLHRLSVPNSYAGA